MFIEDHIKISIADSGDVIFPSPKRKILKKQGLPTPPPDYYNPVGEVVLREPRIICFRIKVYPHTYVSPTMYRGEHLWKSNNKEYPFMFINNGKDDCEDTVIMFPELTTTVGVTEITEFEEVDDIQPYFIYPEGYKHDKKIIEKKTRKEDVYSWEVFSWRETRDYLYVTVMAIPLQVSPPVMVETPVVDVALEE